MATSDVCDILELKGEETKSITKASIIKAAQKKKVKQKENAFKRPEGMHRELYALLYHDNMDKPPLLPVDTQPSYNTAKAKLGCSVVRPWRWMPFSNPARSDGAVFHHWRRVEDEGKDYSFAKFNKTIQVPVYSEQEYHQYLSRDDWSEEETDHLFDLCRRFDLRWHVIFDRFDHVRFGKERPRSLEDIKDRYYTICNSLKKMRSNPGEVVDEVVFDADHERRRRQQLMRLFARTQEEVEEEAMLIQEMKRIEARKREREKKSQDHQKLIAFDSSRRVERKATKKKLSIGQSKKDVGDDKAEMTYGIKFPDYKGPGVMLRSQAMKLPNAVGQKKIKSLELLLNELKVEQQPMPTDAVVQLFNKLRSEMVYLYDLKVAYANYEMELQTLRYRWDALAPGLLPPIQDLGTLSNISSVLNVKQTTEVTTDTDANNPKIDSASEQLIDVECPSPSTTKSLV
uniref:DNA methyltransferase 1-associated protein 1 n=1 Tax=Ciona intestinalis TaxID=7719 RepID=UPI000180AE87|nr:DNA methyltransferase 1-associated protein 1 [Ciona intestinalis]|eukprot:XP_002130199.1 DNA methyltransferase 1-associated protein 1 [Ciona intestinalis]